RKAARRHRPRPRGDAPRAAARKLRASNAPSSLGDGRALQSIASEPPERDSAGWCGRRSRARRACPRRLARTRCVANSGVMTKTTLTDDLHLLIAALPEPLQRALPPDADGLLEIVLDLGRPAEARFPGRAVDLTDATVTREQIEHVVAAVGEFSADNRA